MKRLNITIDNDLYEQARALAFIQRVSISRIIRTSLAQTLNKNKKELSLILSEKNEKKLLKILNGDEFVSSDDAKDQLDL